MFGFYLLCILSAGVAIFAGSWLYFFLKTGAQTFPTLPPMRNKMIEILQADSQKSKTRPYTIIDLGSGSGQLSRAIALALPHAHVIGIELSPIPWMQSVVRQKLLGPSNLEYKKIDFWTYDIGHADALVNYLTEALMERVSNKLRNELKPGALVVSSKFQLRGDWKPFETHDIGLPLPMTLRLYRQPSTDNRNDEQDAHLEDVAE